MQWPVAKPRHIVEKSNHLVRVILPRKKNVFHILCTLLGLILWGYMGFAFLFVVVTEIRKNPAGIVQFESGLPMAIILLLLFVITGVVGIYELLWLLAGKEVIEANRQVLKISRHTPVGSRAKEFLADKIKDLRVVQQSSFSPFRSFRRQRASMGRIAFDYGAKTLQIGTEIDETEAKQIILALKEKLPEQNAG